MTAPRLTRFARRMLTRDRFTKWTSKEWTTRIPVRISWAYLPSPREQLRTRRIARSPWRRPSNRITP